MKHIDLFAGIGGFSIAAANLGWEGDGFCETDPSCLEVLSGRFDRHRWLSLPGHIGSWKARGDWWVEELIGLQPDWLVIENSGHRWRSWVPELRRILLQRLGYASVPFRVRASDLGAYHRRSRCFLVANPDSEQLRELQRWWCRESRQVAKELAESWDSAPRRLGANDGLSDWVDRRRMLGNAIVPAAAELLFRGIETVRKGSGEGNDVE